MIAPVRLGGPVSQRTGRLSSLLFSWAAADGDVATARSGQAMTFSRAGAHAWSRDANGLYLQHAYGAPRYTYVDTDGDGVRDGLGLILEPAKTNLTLWSDDLSNAGWTKTRTTVTQVSGAAPDGGAMSLLKEDATASSTHLATQTITITAGDYVTRSIYVRSKERTKGYLQIGTGADLLRVLYDLAAVTATVSNGGTSVAVDSGIKDEGNGIYRVWITGQVNAGSTSLTVALGLRDAIGNTIYNGDGASGMYFWRDNTHEGNASGSEIWSGIETVGATQSRVAESLTAAMAWAFQDSITLYTKVARPDWYLHSGALQTSHYTLSLGDSAPYLRLGYNGSSRVCFAQINDGSGNVSASLTQPTSPVNEFCVQATGLKSGGTIRLDVGSGFGSPSATVAAFQAFGDTVLRLGANAAAAGLLGTPLIAVKVASGLRTMADMQALG